MQSSSLCTFHHKESTKETNGWSTKVFPFGHMKSHDECPLANMFVKRGVYSSVSSTRTAPYAGSSHRCRANGENTKRRQHLHQHLPLFSDPFRPHSCYYSLAIWRLTFQRASSFHLKAPPSLTPTTTSSFTSTILSAGTLFLLLPAISFLVFPPFSASGYIYYMLSLVICLFH